MTGRRGGRAMQLLAALGLLAGLVAGTAAGAGADHDAKWISLDLGDQVLVAWEGDVPVYETAVSTGRAGFETPAGGYRIERKFAAQDLAGSRGGEAWYVPGVPHVMYFTDAGHALHGTYWHGNFGYPMSHGCVNLPLEVAAWLYDWAPVGTWLEISD